jgi:hypothetical protein
VLDVILYRMTGTEASVPQAGAEQTLTRSREWKNRSSTRRVGRSGRLPDGSDSAKKLRVTKAGLALGVHGRHSTVSRTGSFRSALFENLTLRKFLLAVCLQTVCLLAPARDPPRDLAQGDYKTGRRHRRLKVARTASQRPSALWQASRPRRNY